MPRQPKALAVQAPASEAQSYLALIERIVKDPSVDVAKLEKMLDLQERVMTRNARSDFIASLKALQIALPQIARKGEIAFKGEVQSRYGKWEDIDKVIRPLLDAHGFALSFKSVQNGHVAVTAILSHVGGHAEDTTVNLPVDASGNKNAVQAVGSAISYGKRYAAGMLLNLVFIGDDDDGQATEAAPATITKSSLGVLTKLIEETNTDLPRFLAHYGIGALADLPDAKFSDAKRLLEQRKAMMARAVT
jgi:ERF superfamily